MARLPCIANFWKFSKAPCSTIAVKQWPVGVNRDDATFYSAALVSA